MKKANSPFLKNYFPIAEGLATLLHPHAEVVIHDIAKNKIAAISNSFSKRKVGDESLLEEDFKIQDDTRIIGPYPRTNWDGRKLKSLTVILRSPEGEPIGLMCINLDVSHFESF